MYRFSMFENDKPESSFMSPKIALTLGDPAGIGPELVARMCHDAEVKDLAELVVVGQPALLAAGATAAGLTMPEVEIAECGSPAQIKFGQPSALSGSLAGAFVARAVEMCLKNQVQAMATAPLSKEHLNAGGYHYSGHTDMLGHLAGGVKPVMMLAGSRLRVSLVTAHTRLSAAPGLITEESILHTSIATCQWLRRFLSCEQPRLAVAALNPHAGEGGLLGWEEQTVIDRKSVV